MQTGQGITLNEEEVMADHGGEVRFKNKLPRLTPIWMHYGNDGKLVSIEPKTSEAPYNPNYGDWDGV